MVRCKSAAGRKWRPKLIRASSRQEKKVVDSDQQEDDLSMPVVETIHRFLQKLKPMFCQKKKNRKVPCDLGMM